LLVESDRQDMVNPILPNHWLILGGCPRSGTTLLNHLLNSNPEVFLTNEQDLGFVVDTLSAIFRRELSVQSVMDRAKGKKENWSREDVLQNTFQEEKSFLPMLTNLYLSNYSLYSSQYSVFGDKKPNYWRRYFPGLEKQLSPLIIHISRHPYDVVNSYFRRRAKTKEGKDTWSMGVSVEEVLKDWIEAWAFILTKADNPRFFHIKYEDLIFDSASALASISGFLGVESVYDESLIVKEFHYERDYLTAENLLKIDEILHGLPSQWQKPLKELENDFKKLQLPRKKDLFGSLKVLAFLRKTKKRLMPSGP
jgi:hypothetical protein